jgi:3-dehydroquinate dehydratase I
MDNAMRICGCLLDAESRQLPAILQTSEVDLVEWRLDAFIARQGWPETRKLLAVLGSEQRRPVLVTNRPVRHGGFFVGPEAERLAIPANAIEAGAEWVDLEDDLEGDLPERFHALGAKVVVSHHDFSQTPQTAELQTIARRSAAGADCIKVVTLAGNYQDCLRVLQLISWGRDALQVDVIAFCMGAPGRWSRVACLLLGSPWTYVRLVGSAEAAPGQYTALETRALLDMLI